MHALRYAVLPALVSAAVACTGPTVITTDDATHTPAPSTAPPTTSVAGNAHLANAFDFAEVVDGQTAYFFTTPSRRWECAIVPRVHAGCQNAQNRTRIGVSGAPAAVPGEDGGSGAPNAVVVERDGDPRFVAFDTPPFGRGDDEPATVLPFNRILAAAGFRCNVQEAEGISCLSEASGKGFTFSAEGYRPRYTDVPAGAP